MDREYQFIRYESQGRIGHITLNRPGKSNSINEEMLQELSGLVRDVDRRGEARVLIVSGGGSGFGSGYDLESMINREDKTISWDISLGNEVVRLYEIIRQCNMATIAMLHGFCLNGTMDLAFQMDFMVASETCRIGYPASRCFGTDLMHGWLYHIGPQWARYLLMTGDVINGREAEKIGLVIKAVPEERLEKTVNDFAERLANVDKELLAAHKSIVNKGLDLMGYRTLQQMAVENEWITQQVESVHRLFNKASIRGVKAIIEAVEKGMKPQTAPFEYVEENPDS